jgi:hypothetical protein
MAAASATALALVSPYSESSLSISFRLALKYRIVRSSIPTSSKIPFLPMRSIRKPMLSNSCARLAWYRVVLVHVYQCNPPWGDIYRSLYFEKNPSSHKVLGGATSRHSLPINEHH